MSMLGKTKEYFYFLMNRQESKNFEAAFKDVATSVTHLLTLSNKVEKCL